MVKELEGTVRVVIEVAAMQYETVEEQVWKQEDEAQMDSVNWEDA